MLRKEVHMRRKGGLEKQCIPYEEVEKSSVRPRQVPAVQHDSRNAGLTLPRHLIMYVLYSWTT